jgi:hypothetical protein
VGDECEEGGGGCQAVGKGERTLLQLREIWRGLGLIT